MEFFILLTFLIHLSCGNPVNGGRDVGQIQKYLNKTVITNPGTFPFIVHLEITAVTRHEILTANCGGVIIRPNVVLTAAHCVDYANPKISAWAGILNIELEKGKGQKIHVKSFKIHKDYARYTGNVYSPNDIALLWLTKSFTIQNKKVELAKLPESKFNIQNKPGWIIGWGRTSCGSYSDMLKKSLMIGVTRNECQKYYDEPEISKNAFCVRSYDGKSGHDSGDSGGPFTADGIVFGISSFTKFAYKQGKNGSVIQVCDTKVPGVFTDVSKFVSWINLNLNRE